MPIRQHTVEDLEEIKVLYLEKNLSYKQIAKAVGLSHCTIGRIVRKHRWNTIPKGSDVALANASLGIQQQRKLKGKALALEHLESTASEAAHATSVAFEKFRDRADADDLEGMETTIKIAKEASNIARKSLGLDHPGASSGAVFNPCFAQDGPQPIPVAPADPIDV
jgi:transcriptional regulator with XRE-family HTH domain